MCVSTCRFIASIATRYFLLLQHFQSHVTLLFTVTSKSWHNYTQNILVQYDLGKCQMYMQIWFNYQCVFTEVKFSHDCVSLKILKQLALHTYYQQFSMVPSGSRWFSGSYLPFITQVVIQCLNSCTNCPVFPQTGIFTSAKLHVGRGLLNAYCTTAEREDEQFHSYLLFTHGL